MYERTKVDLGSRSVGDEEFAGSFENCEYPNGMFKHADHIRLAWLYVGRFGRVGAEERITHSIRRFAASLGHEEKYHQTMTLAWLRLVHVACCASPELTDFETFIGSHLWLNDKKALNAFYSEELLLSERARLSWVEPDRHPLPVTEASTRSA